MDTRLRTVLVVLASAIAGAAVTARAEPTLRYNYDYVCTRGLRIVVGHCRHDNDMPGVAPTTPENDYCQVYYPDRGSDAKEMVMRGHLIESLQACGALGATTSGSNSKQNTAPAASPPPAQTAPPGAPSGGAANVHSQAPQTPPLGPAAAAPSGRPSFAPMPIGPALCPLLRRLEALAREDFRSIDRGPDRELKEAEIHHRTSMPIPGAKCNIDHYPGEPITYKCMWPQVKEKELEAKEKELDAQFVNMVKALKQCTGGTLDTTRLDELQIADVTVKLRSVEYRTAVIFNEFLSLDVHMAKP